MYAIAIVGWYGWEGLGRQGMDCEWLAGLVSLRFVYTRTILMGGAGRSGAELQMVCRVSVGGAERSGAGYVAGLVSRVYF